MMSVDKGMEHQFHQFDNPENSSVHGEPNTQPTHGGLNRKRILGLYGVLVLLLLILLMVTGIKFSNLNQEITEVRLHLEKIISAGGTPQQGAYLKKLSPVRGTCKDGWSSFERSCYLLATAAATWSKAEEQCRAHGGHLLVLNNLEELDYISRIVELRTNYWIGLVEREHEGHWSWVDGTDFKSTPTFWDKGQPDNWAYSKKGEDCGELRPSEYRRRKLWNDADCTLPYPYVCESRA
ncbi:asialoglycoprotein receptor-like 1 [Solea solea]|uniref:asialoglycoprotein receptor-like 1 n=1 Tax=Solea solea TaxID=90069 RepID=UPI00272A89D0|nr:asialoglycoprotein receptor-like 1 [Solea solea]